MDKRVFDDAIGEVPPSTVNVDAVMTRGRRADRLRSVANPAVAAGVAVVLVAGAVAFTMMKDDGASPQVGGQPTTETKTAPPSTSNTRAQVTMPPVACSRTDLETSAEVVARLTSAATVVVKKQRPDLRLSPDPSEGLHGPGALEFAHYFLDDPESTNKPICHKHAGFAAAATTDGPEGKGNISIDEEAVSFNPSGFCDEYSGSECEEVTGPNGEIIVTYLAKEDDGSTAKAAYVLRQDGTLIRLDARNATAKGEAPLDYDQLVAIGTDPRLTLFP
jgi:hypothetical protein